jgi:hypothetical protein
MMTNTVKEHSVPKTHVMLMIDAHGASVEPLDQLATLLKVPSISQLASSNVTRFLKRTPQEDLEVIKISSQ